MKMQVQTDNRRATISLGGRFDYSAHREFRAACDSSIANPRIDELVVDFAAVEYLDSSALGMLLLLKERADVARKTVSLVQTRLAVKQVLEIANFHQLFRIS